MKKVNSISSIIFYLFIIMIIFTISCSGGDNGGGGETSASWTKQLGTASEDIGYGVAVDKSGSVYVTGVTSGGLDGHTNAGGKDMFLVKYNAAGEKQWIKQLGTALDDYGFAVAVDASGNAYVAGGTEGNLGGSNPGGIDMFLAKYDPDGNRVWTKQSSRPSEDYGSAVAVDDSGYVYVTGIQGDGLFGGIDAFLVKYSDAGTRQWAGSLGTPLEDGGSGIVVDANGYIYVAGATKGDLAGSNLGGFDMFLAAYNAGGSPRWTKQLGTPLEDVGYGVAVDASGNVYVTGHTEGSLDGNTNAGDADMFLVKYNDAGEKQWTRQLGTASSDYGRGVAVTGGNVYVTGSTYGGLDGNANAGYNDMFLVKYNAAGDKQWTRQPGTTSNDHGYGVAVDAGGNVYVTGSTYGGLDGNTNAGDFDMFLVKYNADGVKQ